MTPEFSVLLTLLGFLTWVCNLPHAVYVLVGCFIFAVIATCLTWVDPNKDPRIPG